MNKHIKYGFIAFILFIIFLFIPVISGLNPKLLQGALLLRFKIFAAIGIASFVASLLFSIYGLVKIDKKVESGTLLAASIVCLDLFLIVINILGFSME